MFGYMSKDTAINEGFTHYGKYYGIPIYLDLSDEEMPGIACKWSLMEPIFSLFTCIEIFLKDNFTDEEIAYAFIVHGKL